MPSLILGTLKLIKNPFFRQLQLGQQLSHEYFLHSFYRFELTNNQLFYQHQKAQAFIELYPIVDYGNNNLSALGHSPFGQFMTKADFIDILFLIGFTQRNKKRVGFL
jgi:hypothetical protein